MHSALFPHPGLSVTVRPASHQAREHPNPPVERPCTTHGPYHHRDTKTLQSRCRICLCLKAKSRSHDAQSHTLHGGDANTAQVQADWRRIKSLGGSSTKLNPSRPKRQPFLQIFNDSQYKSQIPDNSEARLSRILAWPEVGSSLIQSSWAAVIRPFILLLSA